jgi:hypothetical protein
MSFKHSMGRNNKARCKDGSHLEYEIINVDKGSKDSYMASNESYHGGSNDSDSGTAHVFFRLS